MRFKQKLSGRKSSEHWEEEEEERGGTDEGDSYRG